MKSGSFLFYNHYVDLVRSCVLIKKNNISVVKTIINKKATGSLNSGRSN